jgi:ABC-type Fe3+-hydroxamate transport system substrate-binding protein
VRSAVDDLGVTCSIPEQPRRIVSLVPNLTEVLWWWHLAPRVIGVTDYCTAPPHAFDHAERLRGTKNPDVRRILELGPDLVVANEEENRELDVRRLREAGVSVYVTRVRTVRDAAEALRRLSAAVGVGDAGIALRQAILRALDGLRRDRRPVRAVCPIWRDGPDRGADETWWLVGDETFAGDLLQQTGFALRLGEEQLPARYPRATLAAMDPTSLEVALLPDEPYAFGARDAAVFRAQGVRVRHLDGSALTWWGPRTPHAIADLGRLSRQLAGRRRRTLPNRQSP